MLDELEKGRLIGPLAANPSHFLPLKGEEPTLPPPPQPQAELPAETIKPRVPSPPDVKESTPVPKSPGDVPDADFAEFSGRKAPASIPRGARNVKCNEVIRDPDSGRIAKIITYDMDEEPANGA